MPLSKLAALKFFDYIQAENPDVHIMEKSQGIIETVMSKKSANVGIPLPHDESELYHV